MRLNFWPATPTKPTLAISFELMLWMKVLLLDCQVTVMDFAQALETKCAWLGPDFSQVCGCYALVCKVYRLFAHVNTAAKSISCRH